MSALRLPGPDGRIRLVVIDDGAVGRVSHTRYGTRGYVGGVIVVPERAVGEPSEVRREQLAAASARYRRGKR